MTCHSHLKVLYSNMEKVDLKNLTNDELKLRQKTLVDKYEVVKNQITEKFKELDEMDLEYNRIESELNNRRKMTRK